MVIMGIVNATGTPACLAKRASFTASISHEHGISAYPEYVISSASSHSQEYVNTHGTGAPVSVIPTQQPGMKVSSGSH